MKATDFVLDQRNAIDALPGEFVRNVYLELDDHRYKPKLEAMPYVGLIIIAPGDVGGVDIASHLLRLNEMIPLGRDAEYIIAYDGKFSEPKVEPDGQDIVIKMGERVTT